jgi:hypothetical protein
MGAEAVVTLDGRYVDGGSIEEPKAHLAVQYKPSAEFGQIGLGLNRSTQQFHRIRLLDIESQAFCADAGSIEEQSDSGDVTAPYWCQASSSEGTRHSRHYRTWRKTQLISPILREKALDAGCDDYDIKPIDLQCLLGKIRSLLSA